MIEKLNNPYIYYGGRCSNISWERVIDKINELVEAVNRLERQIEKLQVQ